MRNLPLETTLRSVLARYQPSAFLLAAQLLSLVLYVAVEGHQGGRIILNAVGTLILVLVVWVVIRSPAINWIACTMAALAILFAQLSWLLDKPNLMIVTALLEAALYLYGAYGLIIHMLADDHVSGDDLFAAGATFTLIAWGFAFLYMVCQAWWPGSFAGGTNPDLPRTFLEMLFLSFANLSATGLSDIVPVSSPARVLVMLEQFIGVAYIAVVVSRLIGMTIVRHSGDRKL